LFVGLLLCYVLFVLHKQKLEKHVLAYINVVTNGS